MVKFFDGEANRGYLHRKSRENGWDFNWVINSFDDLIYEFFMRSECETVGEFRESWKNAINMNLVEMTPVKSVILRFVAMSDGEIFVGDGATLIGESGRVTAVRWRAVVFF